MIRYLGADVGGTSVRVGGMDEEGRLVSERKVPTMEGLSRGEDLISKLEGLLREVPGWEEAERIGVGVPGAVLPRTRRVTEGDELTLLNGLPLAQELEERLKKPVVMENDARAAALAEALYGAGKGLRTVCYITISTGLGGGAVHDGRLFHGSETMNMGSYLCRLILDGGENCEELLSGTALRRRLARELGRPVESAREVFLLARDGDPRAAAIREKFIRNLGELFLNLSLTLNPDAIVAGGGVMNSSEFFWQEAVDRFRSIAHPQLAETRLYKALCPEPGLLGACLLAARGV